MYTVLPFLLKIYVGWTGQDNQHERTGHYRRIILTIQPKERGIQKAPFNIEEPPSEHILTGIFL